MSFNPAGSQTITTPTKRIAVTAAYASKSFLPLIIKIPAANSVKARSTVRIVAIIPSTPKTPPMNP